MSESYRLQATIGGLAMNTADTGATLLAELDGPTGVLLVDVARKLVPGEPVRRVDDCALVTNDGAADDFDVVFTEADLRDAISDYFSFAGRGLLVLDSGVERFNPAAKIEPDGLDEKGRKYRISPDMTNGQLAVIVLCWFATRQAGFGRQLAAFDDYSGDDLSVTTVGMDDGSNREVVGHIMGGKVAIGRDGWPI